MGELAITVFIGVWLSAAAVAAYLRLKDDFGDIGDKKNG